MADNISTGILSGLYEKVYNPDVLSCLANLSSDEVFTPPEIVNKMLDMLPQELFSSPDTKFLDPAVKTGVYLREIAKRLIKGLEAVIPDRQQRIDHIFKNQLYGIAITELTSLLSRRSLYCSKYANSAFSVTHFENADGNIRFKRIPHSFDKSGRCIFCGASETQYDRGEEREYYAYEWIHTLHPEEIFGMKFDVIISNPPYQLSVGGGGKGNGTAVPIYHRFFIQTKKLKPRFITMIIPARWYSGGRGLDEFRHTMLNDNKLEKIVDYSDSKECFPGVDVAGGICYFLWTRDKTSSDCQIENHYNNLINIETRSLQEYSIFIRNNSAIDIIRKVMKNKPKTMKSMVSPVSLFGLNTNYSLKDSGELTVRYTGGFTYCDYSEIRNGKEIIDKYKVMISASAHDHGGQPDKDGKRRILGRIEILDKKTICTSSYIIVGSSNDRTYCENLVTYLKTNFVRFLLSQVCISQHISRDTFLFVPLQDFSKPWTDSELYEKYNLTDEEINFIESMIRPMDLGGDNNG